MGVGDGGWGMGGGGLKAVEEENSIIIKALLRWTVTFTSPINSFSFPLAP